MITCASADVTRVRTMSGPRSGTSVKASSPRGDRRVRVTHTEHAPRDGGPDLELGAVVGHHDRQHLRRVDVVADLDPEVGDRPLSGAWTMSMAPFSRATPGLSMVVSTSPSLPIAIRPTTRVRHATRPPRHGSG